MSVQKKPFFWDTRCSKRYLTQYLTYLARGAIFCVLYSSIMVGLLFVTILILTKRERNIPYDFSTELLDVRGMVSGSYTSGDSTTDRIVNYFAGKQDLPQELKASIWYYFWEERTSGIEHDREDSCFVDIAMHHFSWIPDSVNRDALYYAVWKIYFESGAPLLSIDPEPSHAPWYYFGVDAWYDPIFCTLHMQRPFEEFSFDLRWSTDCFFEELAHAKQFEERPWSAYSSLAVGLTRTLKCWFSRKEKSGKKISLSDAYTYEYLTENSFEYEAHTYIGGILKRRCTEAMNSYIEDITY